MKKLSGGIRFAKLMEKIVKPRMHFLHSWPGAMNLILGIAAGGLLLLLPLPIPFSNMVPAWAVVLLTAGMMERDGLVVLLGHTVTLVSKKRVDDSRPTKFMETHRRRAFHL